MATTKDREDFKEIMGNVINIVQGQAAIAQAQGENVEYKGIWSIADYMARYYMENYYSTAECEYILYKKEQMLVIDLAYYLSRNWTKFAPSENNVSSTRGKLKNFDFKTTLTRIDEDLREFKKKLYWSWLGGKLDIEFRKYITENIDLITEERKLRYLFCKEFRYFSRERIPEFKKVIGLVSEVE